MATTGLAGWEDAGPRIQSASYPKETEISLEINYIGGDIS